MSKRYLSRRGIGSGSLLQTLLPGLLRVAIGWHLLYEGLYKWLVPGWSAAGYLESSTGPLAEWFRGLAADARTLQLVDQLNIWGLMLVGGCLIVGLLTRGAAVCGMVMLALYYAAHPPLAPSALGTVSEGHYLLIDKNLVELFALAVVIVFPARRLGIDGILASWFRRASQPQRGPQRAATLEAQPQPAVPAGPLSRRQLLAGLAGVPVLGGVVVAALKRHGWVSHEENHLLVRLAQHTSPQASPPDAITSPTRKFDWAKLEDLKGKKVPAAKLGDLQLSRLILGGNLIGGWAHARDLIYVSKLVKAYHHREKIFETLRLAEGCGINTILTNPLLCDVINDYWKHGGGKIQFISDCGGSDLLAMIQKSIDNGACACYIQGATADNLVAEGKFDLMRQALERIRQSQLPAGIGGHRLETIAGCVQQGLQPDFWMKTLHHTDYWSAKAEVENDNIWCRKPEETIALMKRLPQPWIAFKVLAAGAIHPEVGIRYAFANGADFVCVGMYDFQLVEDANLVINIFQDDLHRQRPWRA